MLLDGNLTECIESFILGFNEKYDTSPLFFKGQLDKSYNREKYTKKLDKTIEKSGTIFVKKLLGVFISVFFTRIKKNKNCFFFVLFFLFFLRFLLFIFSYFSFSSSLEKLKVYLFSFLFHYQNPFLLIYIPNVVKLVVF